MYCWFMQRQLHVNSIDTKRRFDVYLLNSSEITLLLLRFANESIYLKRKHKTKTDPITVFLE